MRRLEYLKFEPGRWWFWTKQVSPLRVGWNLAFCSLAMACPVPAVTRILLRAAGVRISRGAFVAMGAAFDIFHPERIEIGKNAVIGYGCVISAHEMLAGELRTGDVKIGAGATIGTRSVVLPGVEIGEGAIVGAMTLVNSDIPAGETWGGVPARKIK